MYELYCKFRDKKGLKDSDVSKLSGVTKSTFSDWKSGRSKPSTDKLIKIADVLDTSIEYLTEPEGGIITCPDCGLTYDIRSKNDVKMHNEEHKLWKKANDQFGTLYCNHTINEKIKAKNRIISRDESKTLEERYSAQLEVLRCLFSRSIISNNYDLEHVSFGEYVAMMMNTLRYREICGKELSDRLIENYGTLPGIKNGESVYYIPKPNKNLSESDDKPQTLAAHFDGDEYTEEELEKIKEFAAFIKQNRK